MHPALPFGSSGGSSSGGSGSRLPSCGNVSGLGPTSPCVQGANASSLAAVTLSPASGFDASSPFSQGRYSTRDQQCSSLPLRVDFYAFDWPDTGVLSHASELTHTITLGGE